MGALTYQKREQLEKVILRCVPKEGRGEWTSIWNLAHKRGIGSKSTFSKIFRTLLNRGYIRKDQTGRFYSRGLRYVDHETEVKHYLSQEVVLGSQRVSLDFADLFASIQQEYAQMLAQLVKTNNQQQALDEIDLFLKLNVDAPLRRFAEELWAIRKNPAVQRVSAT